MNIIFDNVNYNLDIDKAIAAGVLQKERKTTRSIKIADIPNGAIFKWYDEDNGLFLMVDNTVEAATMDGVLYQCLCVTAGSP